MKKHLFILSCIMLSSSARAQQFFIKGGLGYAVPQAGQSIDASSQLPYNGSTTGTSSGAIAYNYKNGASFSAGLSGTVGAGYMFNDHVGIELDLITGLAPKKYTGNANNQPIDTTNTPYNTSVSQQAKTFVLVAPQMVVQSGGEVWNFYARGGIVLALSANTTLEQGFTNLPGNGAVETDLYTFENKTSFSLGLTAAIGVQYNITENLSLWGELNMLSMSLYLKEMDFKSVTVDGQSASLVPGATTTYPYSNNFISGGNTSPSYSIPFSNIGIHAGIMYKFVKSSRAHKSHSRPGSRGRATDY